MPYLLKECKQSLIFEVSGYLCKIYNFLQKYDNVLIFVVSGYFDIFSDYLNLLTFSGFWSLWVSGFRALAVYISVKMSDLISI